MTLLQDLAGRVPAGSAEHIEAKGLLGRAWKQVFFDAPDRSTAEAYEAIANSLQHYRGAYDDGSVWAGLNVLALATFATRHQIPGGADIDTRALALRLLGLLDQTPPDQRDNWYHASRAEAYLGLKDSDAVEMHIGTYVRSEQTSAFALGGTLRQFTELWELDRQGSREQGILEALRAALLAKKQLGGFEIASETVKQSLAAPTPRHDQLQKILGADGVKTYEWLQNGLAAARAVGVISVIGGDRQGTGWLVRGGDLIPGLDDELVVVTNAHVVCSPELGDCAVRHEDARIAFEAVDPNVTYGFARILWESPYCKLDCAILRLDAQPTGIAPLTIARDISRLPKPDSPNAARPRVYVIGYPGGRRLSFSLQDNELLDHEAPPDGTPPRRDVCKVQYLAPTEHGSSGSPVFDAVRWRVIALHHAGALDMNQLNGKVGTWPANEGIWIQSIIKAAQGMQPAPPVA